MDRIKEEAQEILNISQKIYDIEECVNPNAIFKDKVFKMMADGRVLVERDYDKKDSFYYFETPEINGVIIKRENGNYCIKVSVKYKNDNGQNLWFAKIRIENSYDGNMQIMGSWSGSWQQSDYNDEELFKNPNKDFRYALESMRNHLTAIYNQLWQDNGLNSDLYDAKSIRELKRFNI